MAAAIRVGFFLWFILLGVAHASAAVLPAPENRIWGFFNVSYDGIDHACIGYDGSEKPSSAYDVALPRAQTDIERRTGAKRAFLAPCGRLLAAEVGQTTILGENMAQRVIPFAEQTGARTIPFGTTSEGWNALTPYQRWKLNDGALRSRISEGDAFRSIGQDPLRNPALRTQFDLTGSELLRLNSRGIPYETVSPSEVMSVLGHP